MAQADIMDIRDLASELKISSDTGSELLEDSLVKEMTAVIFGSNNIERVGLNKRETVRICERIFRGEDIRPEDVDERSPEYQELLASVLKEKIASPKDHIIRPRREIIQHAKAFQHITKAMVVENESLSAQLIFKTHEILCSVPVMAGSCGFVPPQRVPGAMKKSIEDFNKDIRQAESEQVLDPFFLAAKYCNEFVLVHPFLDGNGRTCRLILNAILLKYVGILVPIGEDDENRKEYLDIARRAGEDMEGPGELATMVLQRAKGKRRNLKESLRGKLGK